MEAGSTKQLVRDGLFSLKTEVKMENRKMWFSVTLLCTLGMQQVLAAENVKGDRPNIVFILADDLGWTDLGVMGSDYYETPNIDRLAAEGLLFDNAYAAAANSAPSRACMMTGMYTPRHGVYTVSPPDRGDRRLRKLIPIANTDDVRADFVTMAEALRQQGYRCGHIGKWHLGDDADGTGPLSQGFIWNVGGNRAGSPYSYFYPYCLPDKSKCHLGLEKGTPGEYLTDRLTDEAVSFIKSHKDAPFFLHLSHHAVHTALQAPASVVDKYKNKPVGKYHTNPVYAAMIEKLDDGGGKICRAIQEMGIEENTIIIFYSDNGGSEPVTDNYPLHGGKGTPYEGGSRVPLIIKWPGKIPAGTRTSVPVIGVDFYPTFVHLAKGETSGNPDGRDIFEVVKNKETERDLFWHFPAYLESYLNGGKDFRARPYSSIRSGDWKLIYNYEDKSMELYNLKEDLGETRNMAGLNPQKKEELYNKLMKWIDDTHAPVPTEPNPYYQGIK